MKPEIAAPFSVTGNRNGKIQWLKAKFSISVFFLSALLACSTAQAQVNVSINIGSQALWGPVGYDYVEYYYMPEVDVFYYVPTHQFIYWNGSRQVFVSSLPPSYHVNLYSTYKVVVNEPKPYLNRTMYVEKYVQYKHGGPKQVMIRDSDDQRYYVIKGHPKYAKGNAKGDNSNKSFDKGSKQSKPQKAESGNKNKPEKPSKQNEGHKGKGH